jgi:elongation factor G
VTSISAPLVVIGVRSKTASDQDALVRGLDQLIAEDPTLSVGIDPRLGDVSIAGMGELQLDIVVARLRREFGVELRSSPPRPAYREALTRPADGHGTHLKDVGGRVEYVDIRIHVAPGAPGRGYVFDSTVSGETMRSDLVSEGIQDAAARGVRSGYPVDDLRVQLYEGSVSGAIASESPFRAAGAMAFQDAARRAAPVVLEPVVRVTVTSPVEGAAAVMETLASRGAELQAETRRNDRMILQVTVSLSRTFGFAADLRARTQGRGTYASTFEKYEPILENRAIDRPERSRSS